MAAARDPGASSLFTPREQAALHFADRLANHWSELGASDYSMLAKLFSPVEMAEVVCFSAWQYGGIRMMSSWGAEGYKLDGRVVLEALPVRLAYADSAGGENVPPIPPAPLVPAEALLRRAAARQSPPPAWLRVFAPNPVVVSTWSELYENTVEGGIVEGRIKQLLRVLFAELVDCPEWAPAGSPALVAAGIGRREREALASGTLSGFARREREALQYAWALGVGSHVDDATFAALAGVFSPPEIVELGYAVAIQNGAVRGFRALPQDQRQR